MKTHKQIEAAVRRLDEQGAKKVRVVVYATDEQRTINSISDFTLHPDEQHYHKSILKSGKLAAHILSSIKLDGLTSAAVMRIDGN